MSEQIRCTYCCRLVSKEQAKWYSMFKNWFCDDCRTHTPPTWDDFCDAAKRPALVTAMMIARLEAEGK